MKKFVMGLVVGAALMFSVQSFAASQLVGNKVDGTMTVTLNSKEIGDAAIIDGTSYLPVRKVADNLNLQIDVKPGEINLMPLTGAANAKKAAEEQAKMDDFNSKMQPLDVKKKQLEMRIADANKQITNLQKDIPTYQAKKDAATTEGYKAKFQGFIDMFNDEIVKNQGKIAEWQKELDDVNAQIAALQAQQ